MSRNRRVRMEYLPLAVTPPIERLPLLDPASTIGLA
jgi:hypothetical protein